MRTKKEAALSFIFITLLIDVTGFGIIIPVLPELISKLIHGNLSDAARYGGWLLFAYSIMQFICAPILGNLSDKYGRRPVLLFSLLGFGLDYLLQGFAPTIGWLFAGRIIAGITGGSFSTATAYIADVSPPEKKAQNFGMIGAAFGIGFIIGPVMGGLLGQYGARVPFFASAILVLINWLYGYFILPESLAPENRRNFEWKKANAFSSLLRLKKYPLVAGLVTAISLLYIAAHAVQSTWTYYTMERFSWDERTVGFSLGFVGLTVGLVQGLLIRVIIPKLGKEKSVYVGFILYFIGLLLFAFANQGWMMFLFIIPYALGGIAGPSVQSILSSQIPPNAQGELQGALTSLMSATSIIGPPIMTSLFAYFTSTNAPFQFTGAPFLMGAFLTLFSILLTFKSFKKHQ
ncbi:MAG: TCR/Tet family MFS transporter [Chitinophagaceae bacterium]